MNLCIWQMYLVGVTLVYVAWSTPLRPRIPEEVD